MAESQLGKNEKQQTRCAWYGPQLRTMRAQKAKLRQHADQRMLAACRNTATVSMQRNRAHASCPLPRHGRQLLGTRCVPAGRPPVGQRRQLRQHTHIDAHAQCAASQVAGAGTQAVVRNELGKPKACGPHGTCEAPDLVLRLLRVLVIQREGDGCFLCALQGNHKHCRAGAHIGEEAGSVCSQA